jgi:hypothetical protein
VDVDLDIEDTQLSPGVDRMMAAVEQVGNRGSRGRRFAGKDLTRCGQALSS